MYLNVIFFRSSFAASMGSAVASTPIDVIRVSRLFYTCVMFLIFFLNSFFLDPINESKKSAHSWQ